jgi:hypothetical protein
VIQPSPTVARVNWQRRLFWVWIVASLAWLGGWLAYVRMSCVAEDPVGPEWCYTNLFSSSMSNDFTIWDYLSIGLSGIAVPVALLVAGVAISRGLRRDHSPSR